MQINEGISNLDEKLLYSRVNKLTKQDKLHTSREHMKAILTRQIYNELENKDSMDYILAERYGVGTVANKVRNLANDLTNKYYKK